MFRNENWVAVLVRTPSSRADLSGIRLADSVQSAMVTPLMESARNRLMGGGEACLRLSILVRVALLQWMSLYEKRPCISASRCQRGV